jgi:16S rRNA (adenine1518-N6/adenine1519-N6)-dimethyltransferase
LREVTATQPVDVVEADATDLDWEGLLGGEKPWIFVGNLPYNVAVPIVITALEQAPFIERYLVMVQKEVGQRLVASVGDEHYGAVSVKVAYFATARIVGKVPRTVFFPRPHVDSVLVEIVRHPPVVLPENVTYDRLFELVRSGFHQRRKMLRRALDGVVSSEMFKEAGLREDGRAEELNVKDWMRLAACRAKARKIDEK